MSDRIFGQALPGVVYTDRPGAYGLMMNVAREMAVIKTSFGMFLPGGGCEPGEDEVTCLEREIEEEIGYKLGRATFLLRASQYHWSEFYQKYFLKKGAFFEIEAQPPLSPKFADGHSLLWLPMDRAAAELSQEFQLYAAAEFLKLNP